MRLLFLLCTLVILGGCDGNPFEKWKTEKGIPEKEKSVDSEKNGSFYQRILSWIQKIKCTFGKLCDKIKALSGKKEKLEEFLRDEVHKGAYYKCKKELFRQR